jgi:hypothetical protein
MAGTVQTDFRGRLARQLLRLGENQAGPVFSDDGGRTTGLELVRLRVKSSRIAM